MATVSFDRFNLPEMPPLLVVFENKYVGEVYRIHVRRSHRSKLSPYSAARVGGFLSGPIYHTYPKARVYAARGGPPHADSCRLIRPSNYGSKDRKRQNTIAQIDAIDIDISIALENNP